MPRAKNQFSAPNGHSFGNLFLLAGRRAARPGEVRTPTPPRSKPPRVSSGLKVRLGCLISGSHAYLGHSLSTGAEKMRCAQPAKKGGAWETAGQEKRVAAALRARGNPRFERIGKVRRVENHPRESGAAKSCREPPRGGFVGRMPKGGEMRFGNANSVFAVREITCPRRITPARRRPDDGRTARPPPTGPTRAQENISHLLGPVRVSLHDDSGARSAPCRAQKRKTAKRKHTVERLLQAAFQGLSRV